MLSTPKSSRFLGQIIFTKKEGISLSKVRIIKKNLVHVHGFPQSLASIEKLSQFEYFGQYGTILKTLLTFKTNPDTNKKTYSAYITYSNEKEAAFAILSVDSLLIEGKIIRAFFGTTKYCNYFLNNNICPNMKKCMFLHQLVKDRDIIIDSNTIFSYNEHLNLAKKIIQFSNKETRNLINSKPKMTKTVFPGIDFIFLNEQEKENYLKSSDISYIKNNDGKETSININNNPKNLRNCPQNNEILNIIKNFNHNEYSDKNNSIGDSIANLENDIKKSNLLNCSSHLEKNNSFNSNDPLILHNIFQNSINHILKVKPFFYNIRNNIPLKEMELDYFKKELNKNGNNFYSLLDGCLDCINENNIL
jgi:hypothetical protein